MKKNTKYKKFVNNSNFPSFILLCFIIISIVSVSIAFSGGNTALNISGAARFMLAADIRLTGSTLSGATNGGFENYDWKYGKDDLVTGITLPNLNSTVTYEVTVTNFVDINMIFDEVLNISFSNDSMEYDIVGLDLKDTITGIGNTILQVTFKYKDTVTELPENITLESRIQFKFVEELKKQFKLVYAWNQYDKNTSNSRDTAIFDKDHNGTPYIVAALRHGARAYDAQGNIMWSYSGLTNSYYTRSIAVGDLQENGYNDTIALCAGHTSTANYYPVGVLDQNGNALARLTLADNVVCNKVIIVGTDVYIGGDKGVTKLIKSGNTWVEDTVNWNKLVGPVKELIWEDLGNGPRLIVSAQQAGQNLDLFVYYPDGNLEWALNTTSSAYDGRLGVGKLDKTIPGKQLVKLDQNISNIYDKDGNHLAPLNTGLNVRTSLVIFDNDNDGEDEVYISDYGFDIYVWKRTGVNTYTVVNSLMDFTATPDFFGLMNYDLDEDGEQEIIIGTRSGFVYILNKDLDPNAIKQTIDISKDNKNAVVGGIGASNDIRFVIFLGISIVDLNNDGHMDLVIPSDKGFVSVYINDY